MSHLESQLDMLCLPMEVALSGRQKIATEALTTLRVRKERILELEEALADRESEIFDLKESLRDMAQKNTQLHFLLQKAEARLTDAP